MDAHFADHHAWQLGYFEVYDDVLIGLVGTGSQPSVDDGLKLLLLFDEHAFSTSCSTEIAVSAVGTAMVNDQA